MTLGTYVYPSASVTPLWRASAVTANRPRRRLRAILAMDVAGYTRQMGRDEDGTYRRVKALVEGVVEPAANLGGGRVFKHTGDGALLEFESVHDAFDCAVAIQWTLLEANADLRADRRIRLRMGLDMGDVIPDGQDLFGEPVIIATRLEGCADAGAINISGRAWQDLRQMDCDFVDLGEPPLKNISYPLRVYRHTPRRRRGRTHSRPS